MPAGSIDKRLQNSRFSQQNIVDYWNDVYDRQDFEGQVFRRRMQIILGWIDELHLSPGSQILDAGTGAGRLAAELVRRGYRALGMDYYYPMLVKASGNVHEDAGRLLFLQGNVDALPFGTCSFDATIMLGVIPHIPSPAAAIRELSRLLRPGGTLLLSFDNRFGLVKRLDVPMVFKRRVQRLARARAESRGQADNTDAPAAPRTYSFPAVRAMLDSADLAVLDCRPVTEDLLSVSGREILPRAISVPFTRFFDRFSNLPMVGCLGGMCVVRARKAP